MDKKNNTSSPAGFNFLIFIATFSKLLFNTARRLIYPFAPAFARGLGVELSSITSIIALNQATSVLGPVAASFGDKYGYKLLMLLSLAMLSIGMFAAGFLPLFSIIVICFFLAGLAKSIFDPTLQAFIGKYVPFENRGKIIGITEFAWAGSTLVTIPLAGVIIERFSWHTPFLILGSLSLICFFIILKILPSDKNKDFIPKEKSNVLANWKKILKSKQVAGILCFSFLVSVANDTLFVIYGVWLEDMFNLSLAAIGFGTIIIGISEIAGESLTAFFSDRIGLKKSIYIGLFLCSISYFCLPLLTGKLIFVLGGLFMIFLFYEFTLVTAMSLSTELVPQLRASTMSAFFAVAGMGRVVGAFSGGFIWTNYGLLGISLVSGTLTLMGLLSIFFGFKSSNKF